MVLKKPVAKLSIASLAVVLLVSTASATDLQNIEEIQPVTGYDINITGNLDLQSNNILSPNLVDGVDLDNPGNALIIDGNQYAVDSDSIAIDELDTSNVDDRYLNRDGDTMEGNLDLNGYDLTSLMAGSDYFDIFGRAGPGGSDDGQLIIRTRDNGDEPIVFQQHDSSSGNAPVDRLRITSSGDIEISNDLDLGGTMISGTVPTDRLSGTVDYANLPISSTDVSNWDAAYDDSPIGLSGSGDGTLTLTRRNSADLTADLSHSHSSGEIDLESLIPGDGIGGSSYDGSTERTWSVNWGDASDLDSNGDISSFDDAKSLDSSGAVISVDADDGPTDGLTFDMDNTDVEMRYHDNSGEFRFVPYNTSSNTWLWNSRLDYNAANDRWRSRADFNVEGNLEGSNIVNSDNINDGAVGSGEIAGGAVSTSELDTNDVDGRYVNQWEQWSSDLDISGSITTIDGKSNTIGDDGDLYLDTDDRIEFRSGGTTYMEVGSSPSTGAVTIDTSGNIDTSGQLSVGSTECSSDQFINGDGECVSVDTSNNNELQDLGEVLDEGNTANQAIDMGGNNIQNAGRVGVGTSNPSENLEVQGSADISNSGSSMEMQDDGDVVITLG